MLQLGPGRVLVIPERVAGVVAKAEPVVAVVVKPEVVAPAAPAPAKETSHLHWFYRKQHGEGSIEMPQENVYQHETKLAGTTKSDYPFAKLEKGQTVLVVRDPFGRAVKPDEGHDDPNAISIQDARGVHVGYVPRALAGTISKQIDDGTSIVEAFVSQVVGGTDGLNFGVRVNILFWASPQAAAEERKEQKAAAATPVKRKGPPTWVKKGKAS